MADLMDMPESMDKAELLPYLKGHREDLERQAHRGDYVARRTLAYWRECAEAQQATGEIPHEALGRLIRTAAIHRWVNDPRMGSAEQLIRYNAAKGVLQEVERNRNTPPEMGGDRAKSE